MTITQETKEAFLANEKKERPNDNVTIEHITESLITDRIQHELLEIGLASLLAKYK